jgi:hypothetical protein
MVSKIGWIRTFTGNFRAKYYRAYLNRKPKRNLEFHSAFFDIYLLTKA